MWRMDVDVLKNWRGGQIIRQVQPKRLSYVILKNGSVRHVATGKEKSYLRMCSQKFSSFNPSTIACTCR